MVWPFTLGPPSTRLRVKQPSRQCRSTHIHIHTQMHTYKFRRSICVSFSSSMLSISFITLLHFHPYFPHYWIAHLIIIIFPSNFLPFIPCTSCYSFIPTFLLLLFTVFHIFLIYFKKILLPLPKELGKIEQKIEAKQNEILKKGSKNIKE